MRNDLVHILKVLWPYLLELLVPEQYTRASGALCKSLAHLALKKREEQADDYDIDFDSQRECSVLYHFSSTTMSVSLSAGVCVTQKLNCTHFINLENSSGFLLP